MSEDVVASHAGMFCVNSVLTLALQIHISSADDSHTSVTLGQRPEKRSEHIMAA